MSAELEDVQKHAAKIILGLRFSNYESALEYTHIIHSKTGFDNEIWEKAISKRETPIYFPTICTNQQNC